VRVLTHVGKLAYFPRHVAEYYINIQRGFAHESLMQKRVLLLPLIWGAYGIGLVVVLNYLLGPIFNDLATIFHYSGNDKPIGGSYLPALFFNVAALFAMIGFSLWALGIWSVNLSDPKIRRDLAAMGVLLGSGFLVFYNAIFVFSLLAALVYFLATNIE